MKLRRVSKLPYLAVSWGSQNLEGVRKGGGRSVRIPVPTMMVSSNTPKRRSHQSEAQKRTSSPRYWHSSCLFANPNFLYQILQQSFQNDQFLLTDKSVFIVVVVVIVVVIDVADSLSFLFGSVVNFCRVPFFFLFLFTLLFMCLCARYVLLDAPAIVSAWLFVVPFFVLRIVFIMV